MTGARVVVAPVVAGVLVAAVVAAIVAVPGRVGGDREPLGRLERQSLDARFVLRGPQAPTGDVVVLALDDQTLNEAPELIERRAGVAAVIDAVAARGPSVIGFDGFFAEPELLLSAELNDDVRAFVDGDAFAAFAATDNDTDDDAGRAAELLRRVRRESAGDETLEASLRRARPVVLGAQPSRRGEPLSPSLLRRAKYGQVLAGASAPPTTAAMGSLPALAEAAGATGLVTVELDDDQVVRRVVAARDHQGALLVPLSVQLAARHRGVSPAELAYLQDGAIVMGDAAPLPTWRHALLLNHRGDQNGPGRMAVVSAVDVVKGRVADDAIAGKVVLLGFTYLGHDVVATPFARAEAGVFVHATAVDNLLAGDVLKRSSPLVDGLVTLVVGLLSVLIISRPWPLVARLAAIVVIAVSVAAGGFIALDNAVWVANAGPLMALVLSPATTFALQAVSEGAERRRLRRAFAHYLAPEIIDELMQHPEQRALGGAQRNATLLFSDIRSFTALSEAHSPVELTRFLNRYLTPMTRAVIGERGYVDKYIGDAIMAVFGVPASSSDHRQRALRTAVAMHQALLELRAALAHELGPHHVLSDVNCGIGLNTGDVVAGNMGSDERFDYTVIGDAVNLASRLEGLSKRYGVFCIVGEDTHAGGGTPFAFRSLDLVRVKGRAAPVAIFELLGDERHRIATYVDVDDFEAGVVCFSAGDFKGARERFVAFAEKNPSDVVAPMYLQRLEGAGDVAEAGFDGVIVQTEK